MVANVNVEDGKPVPDRRPRPIGAILRPHPPATACCYAARVKKILAVLPIACALVLPTGCSAALLPGTPAPSPSNVAPVPEPTSTVTVTTEPPMRTPDSPLTAIDAYALCKSQTTSYLLSGGGEPFELSWEGFEESRTELIDGKWYSLIGVSTPNSDQSYSACGVSGAMGDPVWSRFGIGLGAPTDELWESLPTAGL
jgi:hypothetical protein